MNRSVAVFDFDKTLTDRDTLVGFYRMVAEKDCLFFPKRIFLLIAGVLYKAGIVNNDTLKSIGISLFLKGRSRNEIEDAAQQYAKQIELNNIYMNRYQNIVGEKWIISASPEVYLKYLFPDQKVAGTSFLYSGDKVKGLDVNMFGKEKKRFLQDKGIKYINELYTDSISDKPLMDLSDKVIIVKKGSIIQRSNHGRKG